MIPEAGRWRHGARALIVIGWLLTPVPVWGASALGFWIGALIARGIPGLGWAFALALILSLTAGAAAGVTWLLLLRRLHLRWSRAHGLAPEKSLAIALLAASLLGPPAAVAQQRGVELGYTRWDPDRTAAVYRLAFTRALRHPIGFALTGTATIDDSLGRRRAFYGGGFEFSVFKGTRTFGPYVVAGVEIGLITDTAAHALGLAWTGGVGLEWQPFEWIAFQVESRFRASDPGPRGFWDLAPGAPAGLGLGAGVALRWAPGRGLGGGSWTGGGSARAPIEAPRTISGSAADVVRTALAAVGTPYRWGGTEQNGFDCSGLIQYAYAQHGFALPRVSREQMRTGYEVPLDTMALQPGDILGFAAVPGRGISHVGMWVGEGMFIHSSSSGVRLSRLNPFDPDGKWHWARWVGARRVIR